MVSLRKGSGSCSPKEAGPKWDEARKLQLKNRLQNQLANSAGSGSQVVFLGDTSSGKSTTINYVLGFPLMHHAPGIGTRRPCITTKTPLQDCKTVEFCCRFDGKDDLFTTNLSEVIGFIQDVNDCQAHPEWFPNHVPDPGENEAYVFDSRPVYLEMRGDFSSAQRIVDLPGLSRNSEQPLDIAKQYLENPRHTPVLVLATDHKESGQFPRLAKMMRNCPRAIVIQNFARETIRNERANLNYDEICRCLSRDDFGFFCVDFGNAPGSKHWERGVDQEEYLEGNRTVGEIQAAMEEHEAGCAGRLRATFGSHSGCEQFKFGLREVRETLHTHNVEDLDQKVLELGRHVQEKFDSDEALLRDAEKQLQKLQNPPEWAHLLAKIAKHLRCSLEGTLRLEGCGRTTEQEMAKLQSRLPKDKEAAWFDSVTDRDILRELAGAGLASQAALRGLPSWFRLLDELMGMLAYAPMRAITADDFANRLRGSIGKGVSGQLDCRYLDILVDYVLERCQRGREPASFIIADLLRTFCERLCDSLEVDVEASMEVLRREALQHNSEVRKFLALVYADSEANGIPNTPKVIKDTVDEFLGQATKTLKDIMGKSVRGVVEDLCKVRDGQDDSIPAWVRPVKSHHMNGQARTDCLDLAPRRNFSAGVLSGSVLSAAGVGVTLFSNAAAVEWIWIQQMAFKSVTYAVSGFFFHLSNKVRDLKWGDLLGHVPGCSWLRGGGVWPLSKVLAAPLPYRGTVSIVVLGLGIGTIVLGYRWGAHASTSQEVAFHRDLDTTVNAYNTINREIFRCATQSAPLHLMLHQGAHEEADIEVFRLLFPVHRELADAFAAEYAGMIQRLKDVEAAAAFRKGDKRQEEALRLVMKHFVNPDISTAELKEKMDFTEELRKSDVLWPLYSTVDEFSQAVEVEAKLELKRDARDTGSDRFFHQLKEKLVGEASWLRLCHEFMWVLVHPRMPAVSTDEFQNCLFSAGASIKAAPEEVVSKLTKRRLENLRTQEDTRIHWNDAFVDRMRFLLKRDLTIACRAAETQGLQTPRVEAAKRQVLNYAEDVVYKTMGHLDKRLDDLQPFDRTIQNGRVDLLSRVMRKDAFCPAGASRYGRAPLAPKFCLVRGACDSTSFMELAGAGEYYRSLTQEVSLDLDEVMKRQSKDNPPFGDCQLAGGEIHGVAMKIHKLVLADAVSYCRPRLRKMIAELVDEEALRVGLHRDEELNYMHFYGGLIEEKKKACELKRRRLSEMRRDLDEYTAFCEFHEARSTSASSGP